MQHVLDEFGVYLKSSTFSADVKPLLKEVCSRVFGGASGLVDLMTAHFPSSRDATAHKVLVQGCLPCSGWEAGSGGEECGCENADPDAAACRRARPDGPDDLATPLV